MAKFSVYLPDEAKALGVTEREAAYCAAVTDIKEEYKDVGRRLQQTAMGCWGDVPQDSYVFDVHTRFEGKTLRPLPSVKVVMSNKTRYEVGSLQSGKPKLVMIEPRLLPCLAEHMSDALGIELDQPRFMPDGAYFLLYIGAENAVTPEQRAQIMERTQALDELVYDDLIDTKWDMYSVPFKASTHADPKPRVSANGWIGTVLIPVDLLLHAIFTPLCPHKGYSQVWEVKERNATLKYAVAGRRGKMVKYTINGSTTWAPAIDVEDIFILVRLQRSTGATVLAIHLPIRTALRLCCSFGARRNNVTFADLVRGSILLPQALIPASLVPLEAREGFEGKLIEVENHNLEPNSQEPAKDIQTDQPTETTVVVEPESVAVPEQDEPDEEDDGDDPRWNDDGAMTVDEAELEESAPPAATNELAKKQDSNVPMPVIAVGQPSSQDDDERSAKSIRDKRRAERSARLAKSRRDSSRAKLEPCDAMETRQIIDGATSPTTSLGDLLQAKGQRPITVVPANGNGEASAPPPSDEAP